MSLLPGFASLPEDDLAARVTMIEMHIDRMYRIYRYIKGSGILMVLEEEPHPRRRAPFFYRRRTSNATLSDRIKRTEDDLKHMRYVIRERRGALRRELHASYEINI